MKQDERKTTLPDEEQDKELHAEVLDQIAGGSAEAAPEPEEESTMERTTRGMDGFGAYGNRAKRKH